MSNAGYILFCLSLGCVGAVLFLNTLIIKNTHEQVRQIGSVLEGAEVIIECEC